MVGQQLRELVLNFIDIMGCYEIVGFDFIILLLFFFTKLSYLPIKRNY